LALQIGRSRFAAEVLRPVAALELPLVLFFLVLVLRVAARDAVS